MMKLAFGHRSLLVSKLGAGVVIGVLWLAILAGMGFLLILANRAYDTAHNRLADQASNYAHLIAEHDRFGFRVADVILRDISDHFTADDFTKPMSTARRAEVLLLLRKHRERLPGIASFSLIGPDGIRIIGAVGKDGTDLSDRGYFKALRDGQEAFISNVEDGRASGKPGIHVARRFALPDGGFAGVVQLNLGAEEIFVSYYRSLNLAQNYGTTLRDPRRILISYPQFTLSAGNITKPDPVGERIATGRDRGIFTGLDPSDGIEKLTAFERLEGTNFYATASLPTEAAMAEPRLLMWGAIMSAIACVIGAVGASSAIWKSHALAVARDQAIKAGAERKTLIRKLNTVVEDERKSISIEIHDVLNAILVRVKLDAQGILKLTSDTSPSDLIAEIARKAESITKHANDLYGQCRAIVRRLRPEILDVLGLDDAVDEMIRSYNTAHPSCRFAFTSDGNTQSLESSVSIAAYRLIQEALSNCIKHAKAAQVSVALRRDAGRNVLEVWVKDDGAGFDPSAPTQSIGLVGMRERVAAFNGQLDIQSAPNQGTTIHATIPLDAEAQAE